MKKLESGFEQILIESGEQGKHITDFLIRLNLTFDEHLELLQGNKKYKLAYVQYEKLCEDYWFNLALHSMQENGGNRFNAKLWSLIMRNKFQERWTESSKVDLTSKGNQLQSEPIQIEILKKSLE